MKHTFLRPAAFLLAAGLLFCTLFAPAAAADEPKDLLSGTLRRAKSQSEQEQTALAELPGQLMGYAGNTGDVRGKNGGYHLHLELRIDGVRIDALRMIPV